MTDKAIALADLKSAADNTAQHIKDLERFFAVPALDAWPYVVVMDHGDGPTSALKVLGTEKGETRFNFMAMGREASQYSAEQAKKIAADLQTDAKDGTKIYAMGKYQFFALMLERHRRVLETFNEMIEKAEGEPSAA